MLDCSTFLLSKTNTFHQPLCCKVRLMVDWCFFAPIFPISENRLFSPRLLKSKELSNPQISHLQQTHENGMEILIQWELQIHVQAKWEVILSDFMTFSYAICSCCLAAFLKLVWHSNTEYKTRNPFLIGVTDSLFQIAKNEDEMGLNCALQIHQRFYTVW